ncbi:MAG: hypothetical protein OSA40_01545 [Phycisphaerales bacterium]|nr:hypothetical protein [Phycisphaerales bacterium]
MSRVSFNFSSLSEVRMSGPLITSLLAVAIALGVLVIQVPGLFSAVATPSWENDAEDPIAVLAANHAEQAEINRRRFTGRSPFVVPSRPRSRPKAPAARTRETPTAAEPPKGPPPPPTTYSGPKPTGILGTLVLFGSAENVIALGDEKDGVKVLAIIDIWQVLLAHKGGEYEVDIIARESKFFENPSPPPSATQEIFASNSKIPMRVDAKPEAATEVDDRTEEAPATEIPATEPSTADDAPPEYADPKTLPSSLSDDEIMAMSPSDATMAFNRATKALQRTDLDPRSRIRLQHEVEQLEAVRDRKTAQGSG